MIGFNTFEHIFVLVLPKMFAVRRELADVLAFAVGVNLLWLSLEEEHQDQPDINKPFSFRACQKLLGINKGLHK